MSSIASLRNDIPAALAQSEATLKERTGLLGRDDDPALAVDLNNVATLYLRLERFADAEAAYRRAAKLFAAANGEDHPRMIWLHNGIAHALLGQDQLAAAKQESDAALALATAKLGAENQIMISIETCQGRIARLQGDHGRADVAFEAALAIAQKLNHPQWSGVELHYGLSQLDQQHYAKAEALFASSLAHARALAGDRPDSSVLLAEIGRGVALAGLGQQAEGEALAKPALERLHQQFPLEHRHYAEAEELYRRLGRH